LLTHLVQFKPEIVIFSIIRYDELNNKKKQKYQFVAAVGMMAEQDNHEEDTLVLVDSLVQDMLLVDMMLEDNHHILAEADSQHAELDTQLAVEDTQLAVEDSLLAVWDTQLAVEDTLRGEQGMLMVVVDIPFHSIHLRH